MSFRTPAGRVHGLGSAQHGVDHWWGQRLTALALIPLVVWLLHLDHRIDRCRSRNFHVLAVDAGAAPSRCCC